MDTRTRLLDYWKTIADRSGLEDCADLGSQVIQRYREPHRVFHTADHLLQVVGLLHQLEADTPLILAAWFHDIVYQPGSTHNEIKSAALAREWLARCGYPGASIGFVCDAILATASHQGDTKDFDLLLDADLSVLGSAPDTYAAYRLAIRAEYPALPEAEFRRARSAFIRAMLKRPAIYQTRPCQERFEAAARKNLEAELHKLEDRAFKGDQPCS